MGSPNMKIDLTNVFKKVKEDLILSSGVNLKTYIPNIIEFIYDKQYLDFVGKGIKLFPMQEIILKSFYRGQIGNENLALTEDEIKRLEEEKLDKVIEKYNSGEIFRELVLVLGRRSGKDFMTGIIASYEAMRLLELPGGDPNKYYGITGGNPIFILTVATSGDQAKILFNEIKSNIQRSPYFKDKVGHIESDKIWLLTPNDKLHNKAAREQDMLSSVIPGSVVIMSGHSNSESLLGKGYFALLFDEVASYKTTGGASSGERLFSALGPGTVAFKRPILDENGNQTYDEYGKPAMRLDSKMISISSPRGEEGILWKIYQESGRTPDRLAYKLPTWKVNEGITYAMLRNQNKYMTAVDFNMEFGAEFSGTHGEKFIKDSYVDMAIDIGRQMGLEHRQHGIPGMVYYVHLDPAATSHNYALVLVHIEERYRYAENEPRKKEKVKLFVVDHIKVWTPGTHTAISVEEVDQYILDLNKRFRIGMVSYDTWNSLSSVQKLRAKGIPTKTTQYRKQYKMFIYDHLEHLLINKQIAFPFKGPHAEDLEMELKCLKRIYTPVGYKIEPDPEGVVTTDDICDALAGACGIAIEQAYTGYAQSTTVFLPQARSMENQQWKIGSGSFGHQQWNSLHRKFGLPSGGS